MGVKTVSSSARDNQLDRDNLDFVTSHLPHFDTLNEAIGLHGEEYRPIIKAAWYQAVSLPVRKINVEAGDVRHDLRFNMIVPLPSGGGKKNVVKALSQIAEESGYDVQRPTSYHPEQFIGKTKERRENGNVHYEQLKGYLNSDFVLIDESLDLVNSNSENNRTSRSYMNIGMDPYCTNRVKKRLVDIPDGKGLSYKPDCNISLFYQPLPIPEETALIGTLRRFIIPYIDYSLDPQMEAYESRVKAEYSRGASAHEFAGFITSVAASYKSKGKLRLSSDAEDRFIELHRQLVTQGFAHSTKGKNYTRIIDHTLMDHLLKMAGIQAVVHGHTKIQVGDVERAFVDLTEFLACGLTYVEKKVQGSLDYGDGWGGARQQDRKFLRWLFKNGATSQKKSDITIAGYQEHIAEEENISEGAARKRYQKHKERGWVKGKQVGPHDSRVWLSVDPQGGKGGKGVTYYREQVKDTDYFDLAALFRKTTNNVPTSIEYPPLPPFLH